MQQNQEESQIEESVRTEGDIVGLASADLESRDGTTGAKGLAVKVNGIEFVLVLCSELFLNVIGLDSISAGSRIC